MNKVKALAGGLAGAGALTVVHEVTRKLHPDAPRMDLLAKNGLAKMVRRTSGIVPSEGKLFGVSLAGDLVSNAIYYSLAGTGSKRSVWIKGALLGLAAGIGAVAVPQQMGMSNKYSNDSNEKRGLTIAFYVLGGLVAAATINLLRGSEPVKSKNYIRSQRKKSWF